METNKSNEVEEVLQEIMTYGDTLVPKDIVEDVLDYAFNLGVALFAGSIHRIGNEVHVQLCRFQL